jgi:hypothetical protein
MERLPDWVATSAAIFTALIASAEKSQGTSIRFIEGCVASVNIVKFIEIKHNRKNLNFWIKCQQSA